MGIDFGPLNELSEGLQLEFHDVARLGPDLRTWPEFKHHDQF